MSADVAVVGAGLAGLACALRLAEEAFSVTLLEAAGAPGGRVRTDRLDGFLLDRGFQVLLTAYPEAERVFDYERLDLHELYPGALVRAGGGFHRVADPFRRPVDALGSLRSRVGTLRDLPRLARLRARARAGTLEGVLSRRETSALEALRALELSPAIVERFFRPFLGAALLDHELTTSSRMFDLVTRMLSLGYAALPAAGIEALPAQLAAALPPGALRTATPVEAVEAGAVVTAAGERIEARAVVVAADGAGAARLLAGVEAPRWRSTACLYFDAPEPPVAGGALVLDGDGEGPVNHLCVPSAVAPGYAPPGRALVSASVLGRPALAPAELEAAARRQLRGWFGASVDAWRHLRTYRIEHALPVREPPSLEPRDRAVRLGPGLYVCGDHRDTASIQGALASGRRAAHAVAEELARSARA
ncbi:MAG: FAD-dependent oxidoreductase [Thermoleophilia bacterium]|nr:FAD-dependent oxidoreductase [Thermoleophilia bacterium]